MWFIHSTIFCSSKNFPESWSIETCLLWTSIPARSTKSNALLLDVQHSLIQRWGLWPTFTKQVQDSKLNIGARQTRIHKVWSHSYPHTIYLLSTFLIRTCTTRIYKYMLMHLNEVDFLSGYLAAGPPGFVIICQIKPSSHLGSPEDFL